MKNCNKKFVVGFPVDAGEKARPFYYLVFRDKNSFNQGVKSTKGIKKLESINDPQMDHVLRKLNEEKKYLVFISSSEKQKDLIPDALPDGNSSTLACLLAGYKDDINYENYSDKSKNPVLMVSCSIYGKPESLKEAQLSRVTSSDSDFSKNSLKRKWNVIKIIQKKGTPVAFILHNDDFTLIKEVLSSDEYEEKSIDEITELFDEDQKKPFLVSLETDDFKKLSRELGCCHAQSLDEKLKINDKKKKIKEIVEEEILNLEKELLDESKFEKFIKKSVKKTIEEADVTRVNILFKSKRKAFEQSIEKNIVPKMQEYLEKIMNQYSKNIQKKVKDIILKDIELNKRGIGDNVSSKASSSVATSIGAVIVSAIGAAISSAFLTTTTWLIFTTTNPIGWVAMIVLGLISLIMSGKFIFLSFEELIIKVIGPEEHIFRNGIIYDLWHKGINNKGIKIEALKDERAKDYEKIISELEKNVFKDLL